MSALTSPFSTVPGIFIPTTSMWDISMIQNSATLQADLKEILIRLYQNLNIMAIQLNIKDSAYYPTTEMLTNVQYFSVSTQAANIAPMSNSIAYRSVYRIVIDFGTLPNATSKSVAHNIDVANNQNIIFTRIYGTATNNTATSFIPIPFTSLTLIDNISLEVTDTDVIITTGVDQTAYTTCYIVLEYIK